MSDGASDIAPCHGLEYVIPEDLKAMIDQAREDILAGRIVVLNIEEPCRAKIICGNIETILA